MDQIDVKILNPAIISPIRNTIFYNTEVEGIREPVKSPEMCLLVSIRGSNQINKHLMLFWEV